METLQEIVKVTCRLFYDDKYVIIMDLLLQDRVLRDDIIANRIKLVIREATKLLAKLKEDRMISVFVRNEATEDNRTFMRSYYYIDYKQLVDVVKYKIHMIRKQLFDYLSEEPENKNYICKQCNKLFASLDINALLDPHTYHFVCDNCGSEVTEHIKEESSNQNSNHKSFMEHCKSLIDLLKKADSIKLPIFLPSAWLESPVGQETNVLKPQQKITQRKPIPILQKSKISIEFSKEKVKEELKESVNLPEWHTYSTVTGEKIVTMDSPKKKTTKTEEKSKKIIILVSVPMEPTLLPSIRVSEIQDVKSDVNIFVQGVAIKLSEITEDHKLKMSESEYIAYYEASVAKE